MLAGVAEQDRGPAGRVISGADVVNAAETGSLLGNAQHLIADCALRRFGGEVLRLPHDAVERLALAAALRLRYGMLANLALKALGRLINSFKSPSMKNSCTLNALRQDI